MTVLYPVTQRSRAITLADTRIGGRLNTAVRRSFALFDNLLKSAPLDSKSHRQDHSLRLLNNIPVICHQGFDTRLLEVAIALHDIGVFYSQAMDHGRESAFRIRPYLVNEVGVTPDEADKICSMIRSHHEYEWPSDNSPEAIALRVLDCLDAFGVIGVYRFLEVYDRRGLQPTEALPKAIASLEQRRQVIIDSWFHPDDLAIIQAEYQEARGILTEMRRGLEASESHIIVSLKGIDWDLSRLPGLFDTGLPTYANSFFHRLHSALLNSACSL